MLAFLLQNVLSFLLVMGGLVFLHELGHYLAAKRFGIGVERFSLGFGPILWSARDRSGTAWALSAVPLGGYVKMKNVGDKTPPRSGGIFYEEAAAWQKAVVIAAGPFANLLVGFLLVFAVALAVPTDVTPAVVQQVAPGGAADRAGFLPGDVVLAADERRIARFDELTGYVNLHFDREIDFRVERNGEIFVLRAAPTPVRGETVNGRVVEFGRLGIAPGEPVYRRLGVVEALSMSARTTLTTMIDMVVGLRQIVTGTRSTDNLTGPVGIAQLTGAVVEHGVVPVLLLSAVLSLNLALVNMIPLPVLDGGQLVTLGIETVARRALPGRLQAASTVCGLVLIVSLLLFTTWNDLSFLV